MTTRFPAPSGAQLQGVLRDVETALRGGNLPLAMQLANAAVAGGFEHVNLLVLAAHHQIAVGSAEHALEMAQRARDAAPRNIDALNVLGLALAQLSRRREALPVFDAALRQSPASLTIRFNRANVLEDLHELARARAEFERIVDQEPNHVEALARLADLAVQRGDLKSARDLATRILKRDPGQAAAHIALAQADIEEKNPEAAIGRLEPLTKAASITAVNRSIAQGLLGDALDSMDKTADAFAAWSASQSTLRAFYGPAFRDNGPESAPARVARLGDFFTSRARQPWRVQNDAYTGPVQGHIFLVGFPRSGTTLLEQVFASHPDVEAMEERDCLVDAIDAFIAADGGLDQLSDIREPELSYYRERYWARVKREGASLSRPVFIDKMPLNGVVLCVIAKLFPRARILFALRDPRDVILSCFRRRFVMTPQMFELTTLRGAADYYAAVMQLCDVYRQTLGFEFCDARYEDLVNDFDAECRRLCAFAGIAWSESMRGFAERARAGVIHTPSAPQVARGLFTQGVGQWRRYRDELVPVMPALAPWIERFHYPTD